MLTKEAESAMAHSLFIWNLGTATLKTSLDLKKNHGDEEMRARDLFYALWIPSLFMEKVEKDLEWCLFCPDKCPGLSDCYGEAFNTLYAKYESEGKNEQACQSARPMVQGVGFADGDRNTIPPLQGCREREKQPEKSRRNQVKQSYAQRLWNFQ